MGLSQAMSKCYCEKGLDERMNKAFWRRKSRKVSLRGCSKKYSKGHVGHGPEVPTLYMVEVRAEKGKLTPMLHVTTRKFSSISSISESKKFLRIPQRQLVKTPGYQRIIKIKYVRGTM